MTATNQWCCALYTACPAQDLCIVGPTGCLNTLLHRTTDQLQGISRHTANHALHQLEHFLAEQSSSNTCSTAGLLN
jgi:hypothetical protein